MTVAILDPQPAIGATTAAPLAVAAVAADEPLRLPFASLLATLREAERRPASAAVAGDPSGEGAVAVGLAADVATFGPPPARTTWTDVSPGWDRLGPHVADPGKPRPPVVFATGPGAAPASDPPGEQGTSPRGFAAVASIAAPADALAHASVHVATAASSPPRDEPAVVAGVENAPHSPATASLRQTAPLELPPVGPDSPAVPRAAAPAMPAPAAAPAAAVAPAAAAMRPEFAAPANVAVAAPAQPAPAPSAVEPAPAASPLAARAIPAYEIGDKPPAAPPESAPIVARLPAVGGTPAGGASAGITAAATGQSLPAAATRTLAPPLQVARQLGAIALKGGEAQRLTLQLEPEHLGRVEVQLTARGDRLEVVLQAETAAAAQVLRDGAQDLARALSGRNEARWPHVDVRVAAPSDPLREDENDRDQQEGPHDERRRDQRESGRREEPDR